MSDWSAAPTCANRVSTVPTAVRATASISCVYLDQTSIQLVLRPQPARARGCRGRTVMGRKTACLASTVQPPTTVVIKRRRQRRRAAVSLVEHRRIATIAVSMPTVRRAGRATSICRSRGNWELVWRVAVPATPSVQLRPAATSPSRTTSAGVSCGVPTTRRVAPAGAVQVMFAWHASRLRERGNDGLCDGQVGGRNQALPVALLVLVFQKRITESLTGHG